MSLSKTTTQPLKVSLIESPPPRISSREIEEYRKSITVDGQLDSVGLLLLRTTLTRLTIRIATTFAVPILHLFHLLRLRKSLNLKLEVLDTAGAEQFTSLNEVYIKVVHGLHLLVGSQH
jgi:hypothetical protein